MFSRMFVLLVAVQLYLSQSFRPISAGYRSSSLRATLTSSVDLKDLCLTPQLETYAVGLRNVPDDKLRYQQLLFLAAKCAPMASELKVDSNKVPGCLSTVHVHATVDRDTGKISFVGDSDAQLTKGLVAMLVNGLSGHSAAEIQAVRPEFIQYAGVANSLTPGRNNGFLNMLRLMKAKAQALGNEPAKEPAAAAAAGGVGPAKFVGSSGDGPIAQSMASKLALLKPISLTIENDSDKHAGHAGMGGQVRQESHFNVKIVAACFQGLSLVQRHKMVYALLAKELAQPAGSTGGDYIHALGIVAKTPEEDGQP